MNFYYSDFAQDPRVDAVTTGICSGNGGYSVRMSHGTSGGYADGGPMRLYTAMRTAKEQINSCVSTHRQYLGGSNEQAF